MPGANGSVETPHSVETPRPVNPHELAFEAFGVRVGIGTPEAELLPRIRELLPPGSTECDPSQVEQHFTFEARDADSFDLRYDIRDGEVVRRDHVALRVATHVDLEFGLAMLESYVRGSIALVAPDRLFIAGGVVGLNGRAIVLPGKGLTGKTTLVAALVREGAVYYSDEYAVLDHEGLVHPYASPLPLPSNGHSARAGTEPLPIGAVVVTKYRPGAEWQPRRLSHGEAALALVAQAVPYQEEPERSMRIITHATESRPLGIASDRDDAEVVARMLLAELEAIPSD